jgi:hypothetical protein
MTDHPITPPLELVEQWVDMLTSRSDQAVFTMAAQWGANQELEACCEWLAYEGHEHEHLALYAARRPQPLSQKKQAMLVLHDLPNIDCAHYNIILRALEALPDD